MCLQKFGKVMKDTTREDEGHASSEAALDPLDREDLRNTPDAERKKSAIVSVHGRDVTEGDLEKTA
jgi:hypothetical protein